MIGWTVADAGRRADLINVVLRGRATKEEVAELDALTERLRAAVRPQWDAARALAERALATAEARDTGSGATMPACRECGDFDPCEHDEAGTAGTTQEVRR